MAYLRFDEGGLIRQLQLLSPRLRVAFAAACAERLLPAYARFAERSGQGAPGELASMLERLWLDLEGDPMGTDEIQRYIDRCMALIPDEDAGKSAADQACAPDPIAAARAKAEEVVAAMEAQADDAAAAAAYAVRCRQTGEAQDAAWAGGRAYEAVDNWVLNRGGIDTNRPGAEERVLSDPVVQAELERQQRDLDELLGIADEGDTAGAVAQVRARAKAEGSSVFW